MALRFCEDATEYQNRDERNTIAIHCKAGKGRTGLMICCLLLFQGVCETADDALEHYGKMRTSNGKGVTIPSQQRWVRYFDEYLSGCRLKQQPFSFAGNPITLASVHINHTVPFKENNSVCSPYFKVVAPDKTVIYNSKHESKDHKVKKGEHWAFQCDLPLQGDVNFLFYESGTKMFGFWIHTSFIASRSIVLGKSDLDKAVKVILVALSSLVHSIIGTIIHDMSIFIYS